MKKVFWVTAFSAIFTAMSVWADDQTQTQATTSVPAAETAKVSNVGAFPLDICIISGEKLGEMGDPVVREYNGREVKFCCKGCVKTFEKEQSKWMKKLDDAIIAKEVDSYPLSTCVVSGETLGNMGVPFDYVYQNQLVRFCCKGCIPAFTKEPAKYVEMISAAKAAKGEEPSAKE